jgi:hypothetical protein
MRERFIVGGVTAGVAAAVIVACHSSTPPASHPDGGAADPNEGICLPADGSISAVADLDAGLCSSCVRAQCGSLIAACANDCTCNDLSLQMLGCLDGTSSPTSVATVTDCIATAASSTDSTLSDLASCLVGCAGTCGAEDAAACGDACSTPEDGGDDASSEAGDAASNDAGDAASSDAGDAMSNDADEDAR